jgi:hypothetical protein
LYTELGHISIELKILSNLTNKAAFFNFKLICFLKAEVITVIAFEILFK